MVVYGPSFKGIGYLEEDHRVHLDLDVDGHGGDTDGEIDVRVRKIRQDLFSNPPHGPKKAGWTDYAVNGPIFAYSRIYFLLPKFFILRYSLLY